MVARKYAGILGIIAFLTILTRGGMLGAGLEGTVLSGCGGAVVFAVLGFLLGSAGASIVADAVRGEFVKKMNERDSGATAAGSR